MKKILLAFAIIFGFQCAGMSAELIDVDLANSLNLQVKVEAVMRTLKEYAFRAIDKKKFTDQLYKEYLYRGNKLSLKDIYLACFHTVGSRPFCDIFWHSVIETHNSLVSSSTLTYDKLTEQEFNNIVVKGIECPANMRLLNEANCDTACKRWATENVCILNGALWVDNHSHTPLVNWHCVCNPDEQTSTSIRYDNYTNSHFVPSWYEYKDLKEF